MPCMQHYPISLPPQSFLERKRRSLFLLVMAHLRHPYFYLGYSYNMKIGIHPRIQHF